jgi:pimeloyl-ACP methyl ester carboxylesterase
VLARLAVPALILWGAQDRFASPRMAERFQAEIPGSELAVLDQAGHFVWEDAPERTAELLVEFLGRRVRTW